MCSKGGHFRSKWTLLCPQAVMHYLVGVRFMPICDARWSEHGPPNALAVLRPELKRSSCSPT